MQWNEFIAAFVTFFLSHSIPVRPPIKSRLQARLGTTGFTLGYSVLSLVVLAWLIGAPGRAPYVSLWGRAVWQAHLVLTVMLVVCLLLALSVMRPNPFSFGGGRSEQFDPSQPGIVRIVRHPLLVALTLWALAHLFPNGDLAHVLMFGTFALFAAFGGRIVDRRKQKEMGEAWQRLYQEVSRAPLCWPARGTYIRLLIGLLLYVGLLGLHPILIGVSPLPWP